MQLPEVERLINSPDVQFERWVSFSMNLGRGKTKDWVITSKDTWNDRSAWHYYIVDHRRWVKNTGIPRVRWTKTKRAWEDKTDDPWFSNIGGTTWGYSPNRPFASLQIQRECDPETPLFIVITRHSTIPSAESPREKYIEYGNGGCPPNEYMHEFSTYPVLMTF